MPAQQQQDAMTVIPLPTGGEFRAGDPASVPDGFVLYLHNMLLRPNRLDSRPPAIYDNVDSVVGLALWEDITNQQTRFVAVSGSNLYVKNATGETWSAAIPIGLTPGRMTDYANFEGVLCMMFDNGAGVPSRILSYDGTTVATAPIASGTITGRCTATLGKRRFIGMPRVTILLVAAGAAKTNASTYAMTYDWTTADWTKTNVTASILTASAGQLTCRLSPQSTADSACDVIMASGSGFLVPPQGGVSPLVWRFEARGVDAAYDVPITLELLITIGRANTTAYVVGDLVTVVAADGNTYRYRCTTAGTSAGAPPVFPAAIGATVADNTVTWTNEGSDVVASMAGTVFNVTDVPTFTPYFLDCLLPAATNLVSYRARVKFYNADTTALTTLAPIDISYRDGLSDTNPAKACHGSQWTAGPYHMPFINKETTTTLSRQANLESIIWSEILEPSTFRGVNNYEPKEAAGLPTALKVSGGRLLLFKRRAMWQFYLTEDPDNPILPETPARIGVGALGPRAIDVLDDETFFIGEYEVYRMKIGYAPRPLGGTAMREAIFDYGANWVESQATYNEPLLAVDRKNREVWVYTQKGKLFCYHIGDEATPDAYRPLTPEDGKWSEHDINGQEISEMAFNPTTDEMYIAIGGKGLVRLDPSATAKDEIDSTLTLYSVSKDITFRPIEAFSPRYDALLNEIGVYHTATAAQTNETLTLSISLDRGTTFAYTNVVRFDPAVARIPITVWESGPSITLKLTHTGQTGKAIWSFSRAEAALQLKRGEWPQVFPTQISNTL